MDQAASDLILLTRDLRETWQGKVLTAAQGRMMIAVSSILAHTYDEAMAMLFRAVQPKCWDSFHQTLKAPFLCSAAKINKSGQIVASAILYDGAVKQTKVLFASDRDFEYELRKLADLTRLDDKERIEFFEVAKRWVVADYRLDPTMDPQDPDAKRLVH